MDQLLEDYKAYYQARARRYEGSAIYPNSLQSERALLEAISSCQKLEDFKDKIDDRNVKNAVALVKDKETARANNYRAMQEPVRAAGPEEIAARAHEADSDIGLVNLVSEIEQKHMIHITVDGFADIFADSIKQLEDLEIAARAEIPAKYEKDREAMLKADRAALLEKYTRAEEEAARWKPGWKFDYDVVKEDRHRRNIPLPDNVFEQRLKELKKMRGDA